MFATRSRFRLALLVALFAICAQALLPTLMRWQQSADPSGMAQVCTAYGIQVPAGTDGKDTTGASAGHCPWCMAQAAVALPALPSHAVFGWHAEAEAPPERLVSALPSLSPLAASPRAPPARA
ncbi:MAG TPA: DUF2946 family protein [Methyloversatilis sp.]